MNLTLLDDVDVRPIDVMGDDRNVIAAARVSTQGANSVQDLDHEASVGLIRYLMNHKHGTPFEHNALIFFVKAPIFVFREFHRHRIGFSYNEESARYKTLEPDFYLPNSHRPGMMQREGGKPGQYEYVDATPIEAALIQDRLLYAYEVAYSMYTQMVDEGVAKEVARMCLPVGIFSSMWVTCNLRSLMSFLSLRTKREQWQYALEDHEDEFYRDANVRQGRAKHPSKPQWEINRVADLMEEQFQISFPKTYEAYCTNGRVAP